MPLNEIAIPDGRTPAEFIETFVKPLENLNLALARNEPPAMAAEDMFALRERNERADYSPNLTLKNWRCALNTSATTQFVLDIAGLFDHV